MFRMLNEFVNSIDTMSNVPKGVSIFGSARIKPGSEIYLQAEEIMCRLLVQAGFTVITDGGGGVMEAGNKGAAEAGGQSMKLNIELPFKQRGPTPTPTYA